MGTKTNHENYGPDIRCLLERLAASEPSGYLTARAPAQALLSLGQARQDPLLRGTALYYLGAWNYSSGALSESIELLSAALPELESGQDWVLLGRCYNMLGLLMDFRGDSLGSIDCFYTGIEIARRHNAFYACAMLCLNLSTVFEEAGDPETSLEYRLSAQQQVVLAPPTARRSGLVLTIETMLLRLYLHTGQREKADLQMQAVQALLRSDPAQADALNVLIYTSEYEYRFGDRARAIEMVAQVEDAFLRCENLLDYFDDCLALARWLAEIGYYDNANRVLDRTAQGIAGNAELNIHLQIQLQACRIECCKLQGAAAQDACNAALRQFYELNQRSSEHFSRTRRQMLGLRSKLGKARRENERLTLNAETDTLTGLPNRRKLEDVENVWFESATQRGTCFGLGMLDIDGFKQINDRNGHACGDACLRLLGRLLREQADQHEFVARYGGDEFLILYKNLPDKEILRRAEALRARVEHECRSLGCGDITVTQGIRNSKPTVRSRIWDFTSCADRALYQAKAAGRNTVLLVHNPIELEDQ